MYVVWSSNDLYSFDTQEAAQAWLDVYGENSDYMQEVTEHNPTVEPGVQPVFSCVAWAIDDEDTLLDVYKFGRQLAVLSEEFHWQEPPDYSGRFTFYARVEAKDESEARRKIIAKMRSYPDFEQRKAECEASDDYAYMTRVNEEIRERKSRK